FLLLPALVRPPPTPPLFPYTTLFRSRVHQHRVRPVGVGRQRRSEQLEAALGQHGHMHGLCLLVRRGLCRHVSLPGGDGWWVVVGGAVRREPPVRCLVAGREALHRPTRTPPALL